MNRTIRSTASWGRLIGAAILLVVYCAAAAAQETSPISAMEVKYRKQIFKSERVSVFLLEIPPNHASLMHRHETDILSIFPAGGETRGTIQGRAPKVDNFAVGEVRFRPAGFTHLTENIGKKTFRSVILEFSSPSGPVQEIRPPDSRRCSPGSATECADEKYLLCTTEFCVREITLGPQAVWNGAPQESDLMLVAVSDSELSVSAGGKSAKKRKLKSGDVEYFRRGPARQWKNASGEAARFIAIVFRRN